MRRQLFTLTAPLGLTTLLALWGAGCAKDPGPLTWKELQPAYFGALSLQDEAKRQALPDFEQRLDNVSTTLLQKLDDGELTDDAERSDAGLTLLYESYLLQAGQQGIQDGLLKPKEFLQPQRFAAGGADQAELAARLARSTTLLNATKDLRPDDTRVQTLERFGSYNRESLDGTHSPPLLLDMLTAARADLFTLYGTKVLWRDPTENPANAEHMKQLLATVCAPNRFDCDRPAAAPPRSLDGERKLTQEVNGPVLVSDLLVRRAETLLVSADSAPTPAAGMPLLNEALNRLQYAKATVGFVTTNVADAALSHYPAKAHLPARAARIEELISATNARLAGAVEPPALPDTGYYTSTAYRAAYQCVACHTKGSTTVGFPK